VLRVETVLLLLLQDLPSLMLAGAVEVDMPQRRTLVAQEERAVVVLVVLVLAVMELVALPILAEAVVVPDL
jgi:hypothetical protein